MTFQGQARIPQDPTWPPLLDCLAIPSSVFMALGKRILCSYGSRNFVLRGCICLIYLGLKIGSLILLETEINKYINLQCLSGFINSSFVLKDYLQIFYLQVFKIIIYYIV